MNEQTADEARAELESDGVDVDAFLMRLEQRLASEGLPECSICRRRHGREIEHVCE